MAGTGAAPRLCRSATSALSVAFLLVSVLVVLSSVSGAAPVRAEFDGPRLREPAASGGRGWGIDGDRSSLQCGESCGAVFLRTQLRLGGSGELQLSLPRRDPRLGARERAHLCDSV